ncbi:MAG: response regulator [Minisyncoccia bacterium]
MDETIEQKPAAKHILIIDDDPTTRRLFGSLLGSAGYEVIYAGSGEQGREMARRFHPDLILLDINMPGDDGFKTADLIRNEPGSPVSDIPIAFLTNADLSIEAQGWMGGVGVTDYIQKGVSNDEFIVRVKKILEKVENKAVPKSTPTG